MKTWYALHLKSFAAFFFRMCMFDIASLNLMRGLKAKKPAVGGGGWVGERDVEIVRATSGSCSSDVGSLALKCCRSRLYDRMPYRESKVASKKGKLVAMMNDALSSVPTRHDWVPVDVKSLGA
eukprot:GFKZ01009234.1.p1 GENE.GFKZ01009234.1~~GFKZ01009234.1.p1  ORF type:complete len:123 (+),score=7.06 GFKZ01009234.1:26-394(+)